MDNKLVIIYDKECPFCSNLIRLSNIRAVEPDCALVNARDEDNDYIKDVRKRYNLDEGMLVIYQGKEFYGWSALHMLNKIERRESMSSFSLFLFSSLLVSRVVYPGLKLGRKVVLFLLGRKKIGY